MRILALLVMFAGAVMGPAQADDREALEAIVESFAMGFYEGDPDRVLADVHPVISKLGTTNGLPGGEVVRPLPPDRMRLLAPIYNRNGHLDAATAPPVGTVLALTDNVAQVRMVAGDWYDFFTAVRLNGEWSLVNCVYGPLPSLTPDDPDAVRDAVQTTISDYVDARIAGDAAAIDRLVDGSLARRDVAVSSSGVEYLRPIARDLLYLEPLALDGATPEITIHDVTQRAAVAELRIGAETEELQLLQLDGQWWIVNSVVTRT